MKKYKLNVEKFKEFIARVLIGVFIIFSIIAVIFLIDVVRFPECYSPKMKYQLEYKLEAENPAAIEYYESNYVANNRKLFE